MNKTIKKIVYIILVLIVLIIGIIIFFNIKSDASVDIKQKTFSEIKYLESNIISMLNKMNGIEYENYKISTYEKEENTENSTSNSNESSEVIEEYKMEFDGGDSNDDNQIEWNYLEKTVEEIYVSISTITIDLYSIDLNQDDILNFNEELDELTISIKAEDKQKTMDVLTHMYDYVTKFMENATEEQYIKNVMNMKKNVFYAYAKLDMEKWNEMSDDILKALDIYSKNLSNMELNQYEQNNQNKIYVMLNELLNSVKDEQRDIFLLKYKNLLEEMGNI